MAPDPIRILMVDDIAENLDALEALLDGDDLSLTRASSGIEALEHMLVEDYALALLDVQMPGMDGFELAELMRSTDRTKRIPIIFLTAVGTDEVRRFRGYEAGAVDYLFKPIDSMVLKSKVEIFAELYRQRSQLAQQRDTLASALARIRAHHDNSPLAIVELDHDLTVIDWSRSAERMFGRPAEDMIGRRAGQTSWYDATVAGPLEDLVALMLAGGKERQVLELILKRSDNEPLHTECYCSALRDHFGRLQSISIQIQDITERKRAEATQQLLVGELNHRVKNTLASVQAIASQTLRHSTGPSEFAPTFIGRIHSLSAAHSLLSEGTWNGASLRELIHGQIEIGMAGSERLSAYGPDLELAPELALHLSLVIHELMTNAAKYGALATPTGRVDLHWALVDEVVRFEWVETGGLPVKPPRRKGFGWQLIQRSISSEGGSAEVDYAPDGVRWAINLPCRKVVRKLVPGRMTPDMNVASAQLKTAPSSSGGLEGKRALIIEDEPLVALNIADLLSQAGVEVLDHIATRIDALAAIGEVKPDLVLLDGNLQGETVEDIVALLRERQIPFVMVSGYGRSHLPPDVNDVPVIVKPFSNAELLEALDRLVLQVG